MIATARDWGSTPEERAAPLPCDRHLGAPDAVYHRAIDIEAAPSHVFRWLCQMRVAPYSYDTIDNLGRRSPQQLTPGLEQLEVGQRVMFIFDLVEFERDRHLTIVVRRVRRAFGDAAVTYAVSPLKSGGGTRLLVRLLLRHPGGRVAKLVLGPTMPWGELVMMRRQLLNLKALAEAG